MEQIITTTEARIAGMKKTPTGEVSKKLPRPNIFHYLDYREFLKDIFDHKKSINSKYSENALIYAAGFGKNSRGYFGLVVKGKRNLTSNSVVGFSQALGLSSKESMFFENMVHFCQASNEKEKSYYFERMKVVAQGEKSPPVEVLSSQLRYLNEWHLVVLREMVTMENFQESADWIHKKLKLKIAKEKITEGLQDLLNLGLITRDASGKLVQSNPVIQFHDGRNNFTNSSNLHHDFALRAAEAIKQDPYEERSARLVTLGIAEDQFENLRLDIKRMTTELLNKYAHEPHSKVSKVTQIGIQLLQITK